MAERDAPALLPTISLAEYARRLRAAQTLAFRHPAARIARELEAARPMKMLLRVGAPDERIEPVDDRDARIMAMQARCREMVREDVERYYGAVYAPRQVGP